MRRRDFLRFLLATPVAAHLDIEKLLWIPGERTIFLPSGLTIGQIVAIEYERIAHEMCHIFERDDIFYTAIQNHSFGVVSNRPMRIPLELNEK